MRVPVWVTRVTAVRPGRQGERARCVAARSSVSTAPRKGFSEPARARPVHPVSRPRQSLSRQNSVCYSPETTMGALRRRLSWMLCLWLLFQGAAIAAPVALALAHVTVPGQELCDCPGTDHGVTCPMHHGSGTSPRRRASAPSPRARHSRRCAAVARRGDRRAADGARRGESECDSGDPGRQESTPLSPAPKCPTLLRLAPDISSLQLIQVRFFQDWRGGARARRAEEVHERSILAGCGCGRDHSHVRDGRSCHDAAGYSCGPGSRQRQCLARRERLVCGSRLVGIHSGGDTDIFAAMSRDGGRAFSAPVRVNSLPGDARVNGEQPPRLALRERAGATPEIAVVLDDEGDGWHDAADGDVQRRRAHLLQVSPGAGYRRARQPWVGSGRRRSQRPFLQRVAGPPETCAAPADADGRRASPRRNGGLGAAHGGSD